MTSEKAQEKKIKRANALRENLMKRKAQKKERSADNQKEENMDNMRCSPCAKFTIPINPKIKLKPAAMSA